MGHPGCCTTFVSQELAGPFELQLILVQPELQCVTGMPLYACWVSGWTIQWALGTLS